MSSYIHLANLAEDLGIDRLGAHIIDLCSAEAVSGSKREKIKRMWGLNPWDGFGMTEACMMGGGDEVYDGFHIWTDLFDIEVIDLETGEPVKEGEEGLVVTPLFTNNATPFIRWSSATLLFMKNEAQTDGPLGFSDHSACTQNSWLLQGSRRNINHQELEDFLFDFLICRF